MKRKIVEEICVPLTCIFVGFLLAMPQGLYAQQQGLIHPDAFGGRPTAAVDLTGTWVSVVTEEWRFRMVTPEKGDYNGVLPINEEAERVANSWDPAADEAAGEQCRGYGAVGVMRLPGYLRISWQDDLTLKMELTAGNQVRLFHFGEPPAVPEPSWQGSSDAMWEYAVTAPGQGREGSLTVVTTRMRPGYSRKNGVPYSSNAQLTEYYHRMTAPNGDEWLTVISVLDDLQYYFRPHITSWHFKKVPDDTPWIPEPCAAE